MGSRRTLVGMRTRFLVSGLSFAGVFALACCGGSSGANGSGGSSTSSGSNGSSGSSSSSDASSSNCGSVSPCGGNVVGTWKVVSVCANGGTSSTPLGPYCSGATSQITSASATGNLTFNSDGTYAVSVGSSSVTETTTIPASCLTSGSGTITCDQVSAAGGGCTTAGGGCICSSTIQSTTQSDSGTYVVSGSSFTITRSDGSSNTFNYCVQDSSLYMTQSGATATAPTTTTLQKQ
jgi:hypothetical protein